MRAFKYYGGGIYHRVHEHHTFLLASGLAFSLFTCVIPLLLILFSLLGMVLGRPSIALEISRFIEQAIPYGDYADYVKQLIFDRVDEFTEYRRFAGILGGIGLVFASTGLFSGMRTVLNSVYRIKGAESVLIAKLRDIGLVLLVLLYFLLSTAVLPVWKLAKAYAHHLAILEFFRYGLIENMFWATVSLALIFLAFWIIYRLIPRGRLSHKVVLVSALWATLLWKGAELLFGFYLAHMVTIKQVYGAYTLLVVVAFWIYYTAIVFIMGAMIGQLYREREGQE
ncbi:MAG: YihY/virulence factor BrkB family protein [Candidatus Zixiibacteriota bacterium]